MKALAGLLLLLCTLLPAQSPNEEKIYEAGKDGVSLPKPVFNPLPEFPEKLMKKGRKKKGPKQWDITVSGNVDVDGHYHPLAVKESAGKEADEVAMSKLKTWTFEPCRKDGKPVTCSLAVEVSFGLY